MDKYLQLFGGYGYMQEYPIAKPFLDARVQRIYGGTNEIMKEIVKFIEEIVVEAYIFDAIRTPRGVGKLTLYTKYPQLSLLPKRES